jgi:hypothetical protein
MLRILSRPCRMCKWNIKKNMEGFDECAKFRYMLITENGVTYEVPNYSIDSRLDENLCGAEGKYFEKKDNLKK